MSTGQLLSSLLVSEASLLGDSHCLVVHYLVWPGREGRGEKLNLWGRGERMAEAFSTSAALSWATDMYSRAGSCFDSALAAQSRVSYHPIKATVCHFSRDGSLPLRGRLDLIKRLFDSRYIIVCHIWLRTAAKRAGYAQRSSKVSL